MKPNDKQYKALVKLAHDFTMHEPNLRVLKEGGDYPGLTKAIQDHLLKLEERNELLLPELRRNNETIAVFSDYSGEIKESLYHTYSFLVCGWDPLRYFYQQMKQLRDLHGLNKPFKEIAFKDLRYGPIQRALDGYLANLANLVPGLLLTIIVDKRVGSLFGSDQKTSHAFLVDTLQQYGFGRWKSVIAEKLLRVVHVAAYLVALLSRPRQKVFWMTDHDAIAPSGVKFEKVLGLFSSVLSHYSAHDFELVSGAIPFEEKSADFLDLLSAADLVAGAVEHYMTRSQRQEDILVSSGADKILRWLAYDGALLKKRSIIFRLENGAPHSGNLKFELEQEEPGVLKIPIATRKRKE